MAEGQKNSRVQAQNIVIESRKKIAVTGVLDVPRFSDTAIMLKTQLGKLSIKGSDFRITKLDVDNGLAEIEGMVNSVDYSGGLPKKVFGRGR